MFPETRYGLYSLLDGLFGDWLMRDTAVEARKYAVEHPGQWVWMVRYGETVLEHKFVVGYRWNGEEIEASRKIIPNVWVEHEYVSVMLQTN